MKRVAASWTWCANPGRDAERQSGENQDRRADQDDVRREAGRALEFALLPIGFERLRARAAPEEDAPGRA